MSSEIPTEVISSPALLFLYYRIEQILGIKASGDSLVRLNEYLEKCCKASFIENPAAYENLLASREQIFDISKLVTVNETYFFREGAHFNVLASFLPYFATLNRPLRICSAATSIGCEAYSIAMLLDYYAKNGPAFNYEIDAFDISAEAIETARNAHYSINSLRADGSSWKYLLDLYLEPDGNEYAVAPNLRDKVRFFPHNIMRGFEKQYDVIFFRNALIYFSSRNRLLILHDIAESLMNDGLLFMGISETSAVKHPLLASRNYSDVFYFQKTRDAFQPSSPLEWKQPVASTNASAEKTNPTDSRKTRGNLEKPTDFKQIDLIIDCKEVKAILDIEEGQGLAHKTLEICTASKNDVANGNADSLSGTDLAASVVYFLGIQDFVSANAVLLYLEKHSSGAIAVFLRGEYHLLQGSAKDAEYCFELASGKDKAFWPAFYRIASLAADGNAVRYQYRMKKASESIELGKELCYECFMGGFSPDYFQRMLNRRIQDAIVS